MTVARAGSETCRTPSRGVPTRLSGGNIRRPIPNWPTFVTIAGALQGRADVVPPEDDVADVDRGHAVGLRGHGTLLPDDLRGQVHAGRREGDEGPLNVTSCSDEEVSQRIRTLRRLIVNGRSGAAGSGASIASRTGPTRPARTREREAHRVPSPALPEGRSRQPGARTPVRQTRGNRRGRPIGLVVGSSYMGTSGGVVTPDNYPTSAEEDRISAAVPLRRPVAFFLRYSVVQPGFAALAFALT
jgi:hypothetical protein